NHPPFCVISFRRPHPLEESKRGIHHPCNFNKAAFALTPGFFLFGSNPRPAALKTFIAGKNDSIPIKYGIIVQNRLFYG
ncbi:hypothetical protein, partial [Yersinia pestis]|uniref:hypothetical protein n=1 Tax=Yersinia pestis TaxID=632 RepID=UPI001EE74C34